MKLKNWIPLILAFASIGFGIFSCLSDERMKTFCTYGTYYIILLIFILWLGVFIRWVQKNIASLKESLYRHKWGILTAALLTGIIFLSVPSYFRVLSDETNLLAVSKSMTYERTVDNTTMGKWYYYNFFPFNKEFEKRPFLYPFAIHLLHTFTGYRIENAFILNGFLLFVLLALLFVWIAETLGSPIAYLTLILAAAQPVLSQTAASAGFDLLFVLFFFISLASLHSFLKKQNSSSFTWLWINLIMMAHTRHESPVVIVILLGALLLGGLLHYSLFSPGWLYALTPLFVLPRVWQHWIRIHIENPFETPPNVPAFSIHHFLHHNKVFLQSLINFKFFLPFANLVNLLGVAGFFYFLFFLQNKKTELSKSDRSWINISLLCLIGLWTVLQSFHIGDLSHPASARYYVVFYITLSFLAAALLHQIFQNQLAWAFSIGVGALLLYHPLSVENRFANQLLLPREYRMTMDFLKKEGYQNLLVIADRPGQYAVANYGAVNFDYANQNKTDLVNELNRHLYRNIFVIQEIMYDTELPSKDTFLDPIFKLQSVLEFQNKAESYIRISKVITKS